jgi:glutathione S-transferase
MRDSQKYVTVTRIFPASIERLWDAFTDPDDMLKWHSPAGMKNPSVEVDLRVGGSYAVTMQYDETDEQVTVRGVYKVIEKPVKLVYSWKWDGSEEETEVTVLFRAVSENETEVELTHAGFSLYPAASDVANNWTHESHKQGWTSAFGKLASLLEA